MSGRQIVQTIKFDFQGNIQNLRNSITQIESAMQKVSQKGIMPSTKTNAINKDLEQLSNKLRELEAKNKNGLINIGDTSSIEKISKRISEIFNSLNTEIKGIEGLGEKILPSDVLKRFKDLENSINNSKKSISALADAQADLTKKKGTLATKRFNLNTELGKKNNGKVLGNEEYNTLVAFQKAAKNKSKIDKRATVNNTVDKRRYTKEDKQSIEEYNRIEQAIQKMGYSAKDVNKILKEFTSESKISQLQIEFENANRRVEELQKNIKELEGSTNTINLDKLKNQAKELGIDVEGVTSIDELQNKINNFKTQKIEEAKQQFGELGNKINEGGEQASKLKKKVDDSMRGAADSAKRASDEFNQFTNRLKYFFGIMNGIQLFKRALRESFQSVKELDSAMKEIAVVSDYSINDMWKSLPQFTKQANELGTTITDVYNATGLYVQQGLELVESQGLANETLKMAKIAGMDAAAATDAMTSALRGFNMELNQGSAEKVNDIYSKLAAITASDTQEIATAMSKTASIANNAGASIENTAAFLSQIIETTRESAETAGTALKTVIARFSELKKNPAEIGNVDGEIVDANAIEGALRLANVDLRGADGQFRNFDEVIIELSGQWDKLDKNTQRYIATIAAGSRQQSRFLALMGDNERLLQLTDAAYNSAGASQQQFNKTLDSMESKLNQLKNAWDTFTRNLMNSELIKLGVDLLTGILTALNGITNAFQFLGSAMGTVLSTSMIAAFFMLAKAGVNKLSTFIETKMQQKFSEIETTATTKGQSTGNAYGMNLSESADAVLNPWFERVKQKFQELKANAFGPQPAIDPTGGGGGTSTPDPRNMQPNEEDVENQEDYGKQTEKSMHKVQKWGAAAMAAGIACSMLGQQLRKNGNEKAAEGFEHLGATLTTVGSAMMILTPLIKNLKAEIKGGNKQLGATSLKWLAIAAAIAAVIIVVKEIVNLIKNNTLEGKLTTIKEQTEKATAAAQRAQEVYSDWLSDKNEYSGLIEALDEIVEGTKAWEEQMDKVQDKVYEMINTYPELAQYVKEDGSLSEEGLSYYEDKVKSQKELAISNKIAMQMAQDELQYQKDKKTLDEEHASALKNIEKITNEEEKNKELKKEEKRYERKLEQLTTTFEKTYQGMLNTLLQSTGVKGVYADNISAVQSQRDLANKFTIGKYINDTAEKRLKDYNTASTASNFGWGAALGGGAIVAGIVAAIAKGALSGSGAGPIGTIIGAGIGAVVGIGVGIWAGIEKKKEKKQIQEEYADMLGIDVDAIDDDIKNDVAYMTKELIANEISEAKKREAKKVQWSIEALGSDAISLFSADLSLLDKDFSEFEGFKAWTDKLKEFDDVLPDYVDNAVEELEKEKVRVNNALTELFGGTVSLNIDNPSGIVIDARLGQQLADAQDKLMDSFGENTVNILDKVVKHYSVTQNSVNELSNAYIELGESAILAQKVIAAKKFIKSGQQGLKDLGLAFLSSKDDIASTDAIVKDFFTTLSTEQLNELFKNGKVTAESLFGLKDSLTAIDDVGKATSISLATLGDVLNDLQAGIISLDDLTGDFIDTLDKLNKASHILEDAMAEAKAFKEPDSGTIVGEKIGKTSQSILEIMAEGRYGDPAISSYMEYMFGEEAWNDALNKAKGNAVIAMSQWQETLIALADDGNFFDVWKLFSGKDGSFWSVTEDGNSISFNLSNIKDWQDLVTKIQKVTGWTESFINKALSDAQTWSAELTDALNELNLVDALNNFISELEYNDKKEVVLDKEQISAIFKNLPKGYWDTETHFTEAITGIIEKMGYGVASEKATISADTAETTWNQWLKNNTSQGLSQKQAEEFFRIAGSVGVFGKKEYIEGVKQNYTFDLEEIIDYNNLTEESKKLFDEWLKELYSVSYNDDLHQWSLDLNEGNYKWLVTQLSNKNGYTDTTYINDTTGGIEAYKAMLATKFQEAIDEGKSVSEARDIVLEENHYLKTGWLDEYGLEQSDPEFKKRLEELVGTAEGVAQWMTVNYADEEKNLMKQADLINEGSFRAAEFLATTFGEDTSTVDYGDWRSWRLQIAEALGAIEIGTNETATNTKKIGTSDNLTKTIESYVLPNGVKVNKSSITAYSAQVEELSQRAKEVDFDWMNNFNELGDEITRTMEKLETEYQKAIKTFSSTPAQLADNLLSQYGEIEKDKALSKVTANAARDRIRGMVEQNGELSSYVWEENGKVMIDYDSLQAALNDSELLEKNQTLFEELKEAADILNKNEQKVLEADLKQQEFLENVNNTIIEFENQVRDMVISEYEREIDKLSQIDTSINDANSKLITSIQNSVNRMRQDRENEKTESDIESKQRRLALLRADSSGANRQEILSLEKEIADAQQGYTDNLVDQKISELQQQNEDASAQRQEQISIAQAQLDSLKENGGINDNVQKILAASSNFEGSPLEELWNNYSGKALSKTEFNTKLDEFKSSFLNYKGNNLFKEAYTDDKGINSDLATKLQPFFDTLNATIGTISTATDGYKIMTDAEIAAEQAKIQDNIMKGYNRSKSLDEAATDMEGYLANSQAGKMMSKGLKVDRKHFDSFANDMKNNYGYSEEQIEYFFEKNKIFKDGYNAEATYGLKSTGPMGAFITGGNLSKPEYISIKNTLTGSLGIPEGWMNDTDNRVAISESTAKMIGLWTEEWQEAYKLVSQKGGTHLEIPVGFFKKYATGGLNTFTGPAWLDGTPSKPELVLNAKDTQNFLQLKDILSSLMSGGYNPANQNNGELNLEIYLNVEQGISSDYDIEQLVTKVKQEIAKVGRERNIQILTKR